jgi:glycosyltransferase involved in cell wall biosynthesis
MTPRVTYIVSAFDRPDRLACCLWSLKVQTDPDFEVIVADNSTDFAIFLEHSRITNSLADRRFRHCNTSRHANSPGWDCYWSAEWIVEHEAKGEWICLPSDDSYYVPVFQEALLAAAANNNWQLVYCDMLYDRRISGRYSKLEVEPHENAIDKTGFLVHRDVWIGFPDKPHVPQASACDGMMAAELVKRGVRHGKVSEILAVHN